MRHDPLAHQAAFAVGHKNNLLKATGDQIVLDLPCDLINRRPVDEIARQIEDYLVTSRLEQVVFVAHSKGGLVGKRVMAHPAISRRVRGMVAVATPFGGSTYARLMVGRTLRSFLP